MSLHKKKHLKRYFIYNKSIKCKKIYKNIKKNIINIELNNNTRSIEKNIDFFFLNLSDEIYLPLKNVILYIKCKRSNRYSINKISKTRHLNIRHKKMVTQLFVQTYNVLFI